MSKDFIVNAENISYKVNGNKLFHNLSFIIEEGEALHVQGSNGSGKSTLIRIILGITKQTKGNILVNTNKEICYLGHKNALKNFVSNSRVNLVDSFSWFQRAKNIYTFALPK